MDFNADAWSALDASTRDGVALLVDRMGENWTLPDLTTMVYAVPKLMVGLPADAEPTPELKRQQRAFLKALYQFLSASWTIFRPY
ncbi:hypothetical protein FOH10_18905 [Nocardia otitidiscaviarum]|uniref:Uncharacterized protein n=1 Tax=Nocardia otitidiscaviarum TaxID=1823 RepID=A0A516NNJ4_9NOCA|nr:hypothetical protein [Nocardia otitidiscaviarum]MCP9624293.1 hypothetical protein [Nocardia otitidiscaviarum]QDP80472.1 hypothetical protein FOH10_18905 [Nocardia otitidiscaviarum]